MDRWVVIVKTPSGGGFTVEAIELKEDGDYLHLTLRNGSKETINLRYVYWYNAQLINK